MSQEDDDMMEFNIILDNGCCLEVSISDEAYDGFLDDLKEGIRKKDPLFWSDNWNASVKYKGVYLSHINTLKITGIEN